MTNAAVTTDITGDSLLNRTGGKGGDNSDAYPSKSSAGLS